MSDHRRDLPSCADHGPENCDPYCAKCYRLLREQRDLLKLQVKEMVAALEKEEESHGQTIDQRDEFEEKLAELALDAGCTEEWSNLHFHGDCIVNLYDEKLKAAEAQVSEAKEQATVAANNWQQARFMREELQNAAELGAKWMAFWLEHSECDCETGHCGLDERRQELERITATVAQSKQEPKPIATDRLIGRYHAALEEIVNTTANDTAGWRIANRTINQTDKPEHVHRYNTIESNPKNCLDCGEHYAEKRNDELCPKCWPEGPHKHGCPNS